MIGLVSDRPDFMPGTAVSWSAWQPGRGCGQSQRPDRPVDGPVNLRALRVQGGHVTTERRLRLGLRLGRRRPEYRGHIVLHALGVRGSPRDHVGDGGSQPEAVERLRYLVALQIADELVVGRRAIGRALLSDADPVTDVGRIAGLTRLDK